MNYLLRRKNNWKYLKIPNNYFSILNKVPIDKYEILENYFYTVDTVDKTLICKVADEVYNEINNCDHNVIDLKMNINFLLDYLNNCQILNIKIIENILELIYNNYYQFELNKKDNLNKLIQCFGLFVSKLNKSSIQNLVKNIHFIKIISKLLTKSNIEYMDNDAFIYSLLLTNLMELQNEFKFLLQYSISNDNIITKFFKYGKNLFNFNSKQDKLLRKVYIVITTFDDSNLPYKIDINEDNINYLIYSYLFSLDIKDLSNLLENYLNILQHDLDKETISTDKIYYKINILETCINYLNYKKEYPIIKLVSDVILAYLKQYKEVLTLTDLIKIFSILTSDNFLINYDPKMFVDSFIDLLDNKLDLINDLDNSVLIEILYYLDKLSITHNNLKEKVYDKIDKCQVVIDYFKGSKNQEKSKNFETIDNLNMYIAVKLSKTKGNIIEYIFAIWEIKINLRKILSDNCENIKEDLIKQIDKEGIFHNLELTYFINKYV